MYSSFRHLFKYLTLAAAAVAATGCSHNNYQSGYGVVWVTVTAEPGSFAGYIVNLDSITLTDKAGNSYTALATVEPVDLTRLGGYAELWGSATVPVDTYVSATVTLDYTNAVVSVPQAGVPQKATVVGTTGTAVTTVTVTTKLDPNNPLVLTASYATSNAQRLALDFNLPAGNSINTSTSPATVTVNPYVTAAVAPADSKLIRVRGPLINSSVGLGTYTIYERPFFDEASNIGTLSMFNDANTVYTINGVMYQGSAGMQQLSQASAGTTLTTAYTTFEPTTTPTGVAGKFNTVYLVAGTSLETFYAQVLSGTVVARSGNTLTVRGATVWGPTLSFTTGYAEFLENDAQVLVGPGTIVTADGNAQATGLNYQSIGVGQKIEAIGSYSLSGSGVVTLDASSATAGQVRLQNTEAYGPLLTGAAGSGTITLDALAGWPASVFNFAGTGSTSANDSSAAAYRLATGTTDLSTAAAATPIFAEGYVNAFGAAPPDFNAASIVPESAMPASLRVTWSGGGTTAPFTGLSSGGFAVDLGNANLASATIVIGGEVIDLHSLPASPQVVPTATPVSTTYSPAFSLGNAANGISTYSSFSSYAGAVTSGVTTSAEAMSLEARGTYDRATNTFTADTVNLVL